MNTQRDNNKRIAKNTLVLYIRMLLTTGVSLYTSRVVLATLGVDDYGTYSIVGGVVVMFSFLNNSMSGATSRFLTFELGRGNYENLKKNFSAALTTHFIIAGIIFILAETIGLWWLENKVVLPIDRMNTARWVYQLSIISSIIGIIQVPYNATIIAHEKMNIYAYTEVVNSLLRLGIVFILIIGYFDKLILYSVLTLSVTVIIAAIYKLYCTKNFIESHYKYEWDREIIKPMLSFSGWDLYGNMSVIAKTQGVNVLLNMFFGVTVNTAYAIANQIQGVALAFSGNFLTAVRPQIVKYYALGEIEKMQKLMMNTAKFSFLLMFLIVFPLIIETDFIFQLWLGSGNIPKYTVAFCRLNLLTILITFLFANSVIVYAVHATGKIRNLSIIGGTIYILVIPISYFLLKQGYSPEIPFVTNALLMVIYCIVYIFMLRSVIPKFSVNKILRQSTLVIFIFVLISSLLPLYFHYLYDEGWKRLLLVCISSVFSILITGYFIFLNKKTRKNLIKITLRKIKYKYA